jgi:hypothetical protein
VKRTSRQAEYAFTPTVTFATPGDLSLGTPSLLQGDVTIRGRLATVEFNIIVVPTQTTASGNLQLSGFGLTAITLTDYAAFGPVVWGGITKAGYTQVTAAIVSAGSSIIFSASGSASAASNVVAANVPSGGTLHLRGSIAFRIA